MKSNKAESATKQPSRIGDVFITIICILLSLVILFWIGMNVGTPNPITVSSVISTNLTDRFNMFMTNASSQALNGILSIEKVYRLSDDDVTAPRPNQTAYGTVASASEMKCVFK